MPRDTSNSGRTGMSGSMSGGGWGGFGGGGNSGRTSGGNSGLRGSDGMTASQRAQTRDSRLGLTTGTTWHGNTAYGPAGGVATGYATARLGSGAGMGPTMNSYSNFKSPEGRPAFGGDLQGRSVMARNPQQAFGMMQALAGVRPGSLATGPAGGIMDPVSTTALPPIATPIPASAPPPGVPLTKAMLPAFFGGATPTFDAFNSYRFMTNPTQRAYNAKYSPSPSSYINYTNGPVYTPGPRPGTQTKAYYDRVPTGYTGGSF